MMASRILAAFAGAACDSVPARHWRSAACRSQRSAAAACAIARWAKRFMTFAELPEEARRSGAATRCTTRLSLIALVGPELAGHYVGSVIDEHAAIYNDNSARRRDQPDVPGRRSPGFSWPGST